MFTRLKLAALALFVYGYMHRVDMVVVKYSYLLMMKMIKMRNVYSLECGTYDKVKAIPAVF